VPTQNNFRRGRVLRGPASLRPQRTATRVDTTVHDVVGGAKPAPATRTGMERSWGALACSMILAAVDLTGIAVAVMMCVLALVFEP